MDTTQTLSEKNIQMRVLKATARKVTKHQIFLISEHQKNLSLDIQLTSLKIQEKSNRARDNLIISSKMKLD